MAKCGLGTPLYIRDPGTVIIYYCSQRFNILRCENHANLLNYHFMSVFSKETGSCFVNGRLPGSQHLTDTNHNTWSGQTSQKS